MEFLKKSISVILLFLFVVFSFSAQELPIINTFTTDVYGAENQNWNISQSGNKNIYVANNKGLLEFNGAVWNLYPTPNETIMRSVKCFDNKIFTGFFRDFGYWKKDHFGVLNFTSIVKEQNLEMLEDEQIWSIIEIDGWMLFKSLQRIYLYNLETKTVKIIDSAEREINLFAKVDGVIYFQEDKVGLFKIENGSSKLVSNHAIIKENFIVNIFKKDNRLVFITQKNGFYFLKENVPTKWKTSSNEYLKNKTIYSAVQLKNKSLALGTISNGLIHLDEEGNQIYQINQKSGLSNNTILSVFEDVDNNIWLGLDNGINCINNNSHFKNYNKKSDFLGTIYTSIVYNENLYLGTNQGLFYRKLNSNDNFQFIENTQGQVWSLKIIDDILFCGHDSGAFIINNFSAEYLFNNQGVWDLLKIDSKTILLGAYDGLYILQKKGVKWIFKNKVDGFNNSSKYIVLADENTLFVNHEYKGVFKLTLDNDYKLVTNIKKEKSLEKSPHSSIIAYKNKILYGNKNGVFAYDKMKDTFKKDSVFSKLISKKSFISAKLIHNDSSNKVWCFSKDNIKYLTPGKLSSKPEINTIFISENIPKAAPGYENIIQVSKDVYLIGTSNGYLELNLNNYTEPKDFSIYLNKIKSFKTDGKKTNLNVSKKAILNNNDNNLEFFFSVPNFEKILTTKYQYQLEGLNKSWSEPSTVNSILFENIPSGNYKLKVKAIIGNKVSENIDIFNFKIKRPWYFSNPLIVLYSFLALLAFYAVHIASKRYYKKQREDLLEKAKKESELKELESSQQIIKLNNDKLRNDIESKNRELASSTMNMIKKNEFLSTIKTELVDGGEKNIPKVIKIIDKNLNNSDDWKMFQEAFNNADKNFLKKVKDKHPNLTPNDLRLCAYLRLNLSSKEIAPLLNISPRSVEVKRYRLRKKMNLPHDSNLTNYILEL
ncbi:triple tyrosine motif-containing protein [Polaribacter sp.]|uniref:helix-turn-helix and ligand-binding sensor domain-containing protein n=1 Tax=Polaribacter sp. TaxID=1920175 RepID=UPI003F6B9E15